MLRNLTLNINIYTIYTHNAQMVRPNLLKKIPSNFVLLYDFVHFKINV